MIHAAKGSSARGGVPRRGGTPVLAGEPRPNLLTGPYVVGVMWQYRTPGIPDGLFERAEGVPITKEEIRAIQISKARLAAGDTIYDIGCGSGSVSVEAAIQVGEEGQVLAVDRDPVAVRLTDRNATRFGMRNIFTHLGEARGVIPGLPEPDAVIVGGTGGETADILRMCARRLRPGGRIVVGTILVETLAEVLATIQGSGLVDADVVQVTILKSRRTTTGTMMLARNPVTIVSASASAGCVKERRR